MTVDDFLRQVHRQAAEYGLIAVFWSWEDVQQVRPDLSEDDCRDVIERVGYRHDAELGITWETLRLEADGMFPQAEISPREAEDT